MSQNSLGLYPIGGFTPLLCLMIDFDARLHQLIDAALQEDVGDGDHSTLCCIPADAKGRAVLKIKQNGILAGVDVARKIFQYKKPSARFILYKNDGEEMRAGDIAFEVETSVHTILQLERLVLNCMQRMSGIATLTKQYTDKLKGHTTKLLDTWKTRPSSKMLCYTPWNKVPVPATSATVRSLHQIPPNLPKPSFRALEKRHR